MSNLRHKLHEIDTTIEAISHGIKSSSSSYNFYSSKLNVAKLKRERLRAMSAFVKSQQIVNEMDKILAENELLLELSELKKTTTKEMEKSNKRNSKSSGKENNRRTSKQKSIQQDLKHSKKQPKKSTKTKVEKLACSKKHIQNITNTNINSPVSRNSLEGSVSAKRRIFFEDDSCAATTLLCLKCTAHSICSECKHDNLDFNSNETSIQ